MPLLMLHSKEPSCTTVHGAVAVYKLQCQPVTHQVQAEKLGQRPSCGAKLPHQVSANVAQPVKGKVAQAAQLRQVSADEHCSECGAINKVLTGRVNWRQHQLREANRQPARTVG